MGSKEKLEEVLSKMTDDYNENYTILRSFFEQYCNSGEWLIHLTDEKYSELECYVAIKTLLLKGYDPNLENHCEYNFIQNAMYESYSSDFIVKLINLSASHGLAVNHQDSDGDTMLHTAIYADDFKGNILEIYKALINAGFDSRIKDNSRRDIVEAMKFEKKRCNKFSDKEIREVENLYNSEIDRLTSKKNSESKVDIVLAKMGYDLPTNIKVLLNELPKFGMKKDNFLLGLTDEEHNELSCFAALKALIHYNVCNINKTDESRYNFIQNAMYAGYSTAFINGCIDACNDSSITYKLDINHRDEDGDTMLHSAIYCNDKCVLNIASVYSTLLKYGFDSGLKDNEGRSIVDAMKYEKKRCNKFSDEEIDEVEKIYNSKLGIENTAFSKDELSQNRRLNEEGLASFLKKCKR
jgi:ankyrin repeat protein